MRKQADLPRFWNSDATKWNFGDAIAYFLRQRLFLDIAPFSRDPWTVGSALFDGAPLLSADRDDTQLPSFFDDRNCEAIFWGCGLREPGSLSKGFAENCAILAVRGPLSASDLCLGAEMPMGDPALLLPALYQPSRRHAFVGKTVCVPHYHETRSDLELLAASGCDLVLRPSIDPDLAGIETFIDALTSADFILCGAMHAAITAAAYGVPFGYWDTGNIDIPFKWEDFSALVRISCVFSPNLETARRHYESEIRSTIELPSTWGLIGSAPFPIRPSALLKILRYEMSRSSDEAIPAIDRALQELAPQDRYSDHFVALSRQIVNEVIPALARDRDLARQQVAEKTAENEKTQSDYAILKADLLTSVADADDKARALIAAVARAEASEQDVQRLLALDATLKEELQLLRTEWSGLSHQIAAQSTQDVATREGHALEVQALRSDLLSLSSERDALHRELQAWRSETVAREQQALDERSRLADELISQHAAALFEKETELDRARLALSASNDQIAALAEVEIERDRLSTDMELTQKRFSDLEIRAADLEIRAADLDQARRAAEGCTHAANQSVEVLRGDTAHALAERDAAVSQVGRLFRRLRRNKWARRIAKLPVIAKHDRRLRERVALIETFLAQFSDAQLGMSAEGRTDRITAYLLGVTSHIADFPLIDRDIYRTLQPDVAEAAIDPFIHYLENGYKEGRTPHPLLDYEYYTRLYPETARYGQSIVEHYVRFGVPKYCDPCAMFSTKEYFELHPDVKISGCNPLIHYLRNPDCRPHPHFDSHFYRVSNPDVVRAGFNPLVHFLLYGRAEGRRPTPSHGDGPSFAAWPVKAEAAREPTIAAAAPAPVQISSVPRTMPAQRPLVLMMDAFYPRPDHDSGSLDQVNFVRIFQSLGYDVAFAALMDFAPRPDASAALQSRGVHCVTAADYISVEEFVVLNRERISTFFLSRFNFGGNWIERARSFCPRARIVLNTVDLHHVREERLAQLTGDALASSNAAKTKEAELAAIAAADVSIVVSRVERDILDTLLPAADVRVIPLIREVQEHVRPPFGKRHGIAFVGGFQHLPNIDAVTYFLDEIWPKILVADPTITFHVIGSHMPDSLKQRTDRNVEWVGFVSELEPWLDRVRLTVAPLRYGAGAKGKVVSSLLNGVPCVATAIASEGMGFDEGEGVVTANGTEEFARLVTILHDDEKQWTRLSERGFEAVRRSYSLDQGIDLVEQILPRLSAREGAQR